LYQISHCYCYCCIIIIIIIIIILFVTRNCQIALLLQYEELIAGFGGGKRGRGMERTRDGKGMKGREGK